MKIAFKYCWLISILFYSCSTTKSTYKEAIIPIENEYAKVKIEKIDNLNFENINYGWKKSIQNIKKDSITSEVNSNYPNPFSPTTRFQWIVIEPDSFSIMLFDIKGNKISSLYKGYLTKGKYEMNFHETNLNSGAYFLMMDVGKEKYYRKFLWLK